MDIAHVMGWLLKCLSLDWISRNAFHKCVTSRAVVRDVQQITCTKFQGFNKRFYIKGLTA